MDPSNKTKWRERLRLYWPLGLLALAGLVVVLLQTRFGPGASGDSSSYLMGARNIVAGNGFYRFSGGYELKPITGFPPMYSAVLAVFGETGLNLLLVARLLDAVLFMINLVFVGLLVHRFTGSLWPSLAAEILMLLSDTQVSLHSWVMSEPLYIFLSLSALLVLVEYLEHPRGLKLVAFSLIIAASGLTRYVGVSLAGVAALSVLFFRGGGLRGRLVSSAISLGVGVIPVYLWLLRNARLAGTMTNRVIIFHPIDPTLLRYYLAEISSWFVPNHVPLPTSARAGLAILVAFGIPLLTTVLIYLRRRSALAEGSWQDRVRSIGLLPTIIIGYVAAYVAVLFLNSTFLDAATTLSAPSRYLAPVFVVVDILMCGLAFRMVRLVRWPRGITVFALVYLVFLGIFYLQPTLKLLRNPIDAIGYTGDRYKWPAVVERLEQIEEASSIISNNPEMVYILTGRPAYVRPIQFDVYQQQYRQDFQQQIDETKARLKQGAVYVVFMPIEAIDRKVVSMTGAVKWAEYPQAVFFVYPGVKSGD